MREDGWCIIRRRIGIDGQFQEGFAPGRSCSKLRCPQAYTFIMPCIHVHEFQDEVMMIRCFTDSRVTCDMTYIILNSFPSNAQSIALHFRKLPDRQREGVNGEALLDRRRQPVDQRKSAHGRASVKLRTCAHVL